MEVDIVTVTMATPLASPRAAMTLDIVELVLDVSLSLPTPRALRIFQKRFPRLLAVARPCAKASFGLP